MEKELEVKILNIDVENIKNKLESCGATFIKKENQVNYHITSSNFNFIEDGSYLRIRSLKDDDGKEIKSEITFKQNFSNEFVRENNEYSSSIKNTNMMLEILKNIGYDIVEKANKTRFSYKLNKARIDIDIWDKKVYPHPYMEIEVKNYDDLYEVLEILDIEKNQISLKSIKELQNDLNGGR